MSDHETMTIRPRQRRMHAMQWDGTLESLNAIRAWLADNGNELHLVDLGTAPPETECVPRVSTKHDGLQPLRPKFWVVQLMGDNGFVPCPPELFSDLYEQESDLLDTAWGVIANAHDGDWDKATDAWRSAAESWRDAYNEATAGRSA